MKIVIQRVKHSSVKVDEVIISKIDQGLNLLVCMEKGDDLNQVNRAIKKVLALRIFSDDFGRMNNSICDIDGEILCISQFTLSWNGKKGNRPSFDNSMEPESARSLFDDFVEGLKSNYKTDKIKTGSFGSLMEVAITNDGPVTFSIDF